MSGTRKYSGTTHDVIHFGAGPGHLSWHLSREGGTLSASEQGPTRWEHGMSITGDSLSAKAPTREQFDAAWADAEAGR